MEASIQELNALIAHINREIKRWENTDGWSAHNNISKLETAKWQAQEKITQRAASFGLDIRTDGI